MARIQPDGWRELGVTGAAQREIETLETLASGLPDAYTVYHGVHWTNLEHGFAVFGEIDFVVVNASGHLLLIEQKSGFLNETPEGLVKSYGEKSKSVPFQMARTVNAVTAKLRKRPGCEEVKVDYLLFCPDYTVRKVESAGVSPERIVDSPRKAHLARYIQAALPEGEPGARAPHAHRFLRDTVQLESDVSALVGRAGQMVTRISGGLAHWARQLEMAPFRLRVTATAGSGKTQLALKEYEATLAVGRRPLYVCYNRPLADHFVQIAPEGGLVATFHMLCDQLLRSTGVAPDFGQPQAFERLVAEAAALPIGPDWQFDTVIVDEGQDFHTEWRDLVLRHARPDARLFWLEDPMQNLRGLPEVPLLDWVRLRAETNHRSPRGVVKLLNTLLPETSQVEAASPFLGADLEVLTYSDAAGLTQSVKEAIKQCFAAGYKRDDIAIVTFRGREQSLLFPNTQLGQHTLRTFTGHYDLLGHPVYSEGDLLMETVYRFKGQAAPAIVFAEIDFEELDEKTLRKLFVGMTRATLKLVLVVSERAAGRLLDKLG
jgi:hypothetical protein